MQKQLGFIVFITLVGLVGGCSDDTTSGPTTTPVCAPNETVECTCVDGNSGFQLCNGDGSGYEAPCACPEDGGEGPTDPDGKGEEGGADTTADEGGESTDEGGEDSTEPEGGEGEDSTEPEGGEGEDTTEPEGGEEGDATEPEGGEGEDTTEPEGGEEGGTEEDYVTGDGGPFVEPQEPVSCITGLTRTHTSGVGGVIYRGLSNTSFFDHPTAPVREENGHILTGMVLMGDGLCARDTADVLWCWDTAIPTQQAPGTDFPTALAARPVLEADGEPLRVTEEGVALQPSSGPYCFVRTDGTLACWGSTGYNGSLGPLFPETPGCNQCASYPVTVLTEGQVGTPLENMVQVDGANGNSRTLAAVDKDGHLWVWGEAGLGALLGEAVSEPFHHPQILEGVPPLERIVVQLTNLCGIVAEDQSLLCTHKNVPGSWIPIETPEGTPLKGVVQVEKVNERFVVRTEGGGVYGLEFGSDPDVDEWSTFEIVVQGETLSDLALMSRTQNSATLMGLDTEGAFYHFALEDGSFFTSQKWVVDLPALFDTPCLECVPKCGVKDCSSDGCGGQCWNCASDAHTCLDGVCIPPDCEPACSEAECGDDGCGGTCGSCGDGEMCLDGECTQESCIREVQSRSGLTRNGNVFRLCSADGGTCKVENISAILSEGSDVEVLSGVTRLLEASSYLVCGEKEGALWCWSYSSNTPSSIAGVEGSGLPPNRGYPAQEEDGSPITDFVHGSTNLRNACIVRESGLLECWGAEGYYTFDNPECDADCHFHPQPVLNEEGGEPVTDASKVFMTEWRTCFIRTDGSVWCWGKDDFGFGVTGWELEEPQSYPEPVEGLPAPAVDLSIGSKSMCALLEDTSVWCWGTGYHSPIGITGQSQVEYIHYPEPVRYGPYGEIVTGVADVVHASFKFTTLRMENGDILTWGDKDWSNTSLYQPSPDWYPFEGLPIQNARAIEYNSGEGIRYILGETGLVLSSKAKSGNVIDRSAGPIYDIACDQFSQE